MKCSRNLNPQFVSAAPSVTPALCSASSPPSEHPRQKRRGWILMDWGDLNELDGDVILLWGGGGGGGERVPYDKWCNGANTARISSLTQRCVHLITTSYFPPCLARQPPARSSPRHLADAPTLLRPTLAPFYCPPAANGAAVCHVGRADDFSRPTLTSETNQISAGP